MIRTALFNVSAKPLKSKIILEMFSFIYLLFFFAHIICYFYPIKEAATYNPEHDLSNFVKFQQFYGFLFNHPSPQFQCSRNDVWLLQNLRLSLSNNEFGGKGENFLLCIFLFPKYCQNQKFEYIIVYPIMKQSMNYYYIILNLFILNYIKLLCYIILHYVTSYIHFTTCLQFV